MTSPTLCSICARAPAAPLLNVCPACAAVDQLSQQIESPPEALTDAEIELHQRIDALTERVEITRKRLLGTIVAVCLVGWLAFMALVVALRIF